MFNVTAGNGNDGESGTNGNFLAMGLNNSVGASAMDVDFFAYKQGVLTPAPTDTTSPIGLRFALTNQDVPEGAIVKFSTIVTGAPPYYIQWQRNAGGGGFTNVPGATAASYMLGPVLPSDDASMFLLIASNNFSVVTSSVVTLTVTAFPSDPNSLPLVWSNIPPDPNHIRDGQPDSLADVFANEPASDELARTMPIVLELGSQVTNGLEVLQALFDASPPPTSIP